VKKFRSCSRLVPTCELQISNTRYVLKLRRVSSAIHVRRRDLFKYRDFRLAVGGQFISQSSDALSSLTLAQIMLFTFTKAPSITALTTALVVSAVPLLLIGPLAGHLADRFERKKILSRGNVLRGAITFCGLIALSSETRWVGYLVIAILVSLTRILYTARATALAQLVRRHELVAADSMSLILSVIAGAIGVGVGTLISSSSPALGLCLSAMGQLSAAALFNKISVPLGGGTRIKTNTNRFDFRMLGEQFMARKTRFAMLATALHRLLFGVCIASIALMVDRSYHLQTTGYITVLGSSACGSFIGSNTAEWISERYPRRSITVMSFLIAGVAIGIAASSSNPRVGIVAIAACALAFQNLRIRSDATIQANSSKENLGRIFATYDMFYNFAFIGGCSIGIIASRLANYGQVLGAVAISYTCVSGAFLKISDGKDSDAKKSHPTNYQPAKVEHPVIEVVY